MAALRAENVILADRWDCVLLDTKQALRASKYGDEQSIISQHIYKINRHLACSSPAILAGWRRSTSD
jgi:hypothetical protein